jgi:hypothetical protein
VSIRRITWEIMLRHGHRLKESAMALKALSSEEFDDKVRPERELIDQAATIQS